MANCICTRSHLSRPLGTNVSRSASSLAQGGCCKMNHFYQCRSCRVMGSLECHDDRQSVGKKKKNCGAGEAAATSPLRETQRDGLTGQWAIPYPLPRYFTFRRQSTTGKYLISIWPHKSIHSTRLARANPMPPPNSMRMATLQRGNMDPSALMLPGVCHRQPITTVAGDGAGSATQEEPMTTIRPGPCRAFPRASSCPGPLGRGTSVPGRS